MNESKERKDPRRYLVPARDSLAALLLLGSLTMWFFGNVSQLGMAAGA